MCSEIHLRKQGIFLETYMVPKNLKGWDKRFSKVKRKSLKINFILECLPLSIYRDTYQLEEIIGEIWKREFFKAFFIYYLWS